MDERTDEGRDEGMKEWMNEWMNEWASESMNALIPWGKALGKSKQLIESGAALSNNCIEKSRRVFWNPYVAEVASVYMLLRWTFKNMLFFQIENGYGLLCYKKNIKKKIFAVLNKVSIGV